MRKIYAEAGTQFDIELREAFTMYGLKPSVDADSRGRFYEIVIPDYWSARRQAKFDRAVSSAMKSPPE